MHVVCIRNGPLTFQNVHNVATYKHAATTHIVNIYSSLPTMSFHPTGVTIEIVGTEASSNGRSCEAHEVCGRSVLFDDVVVRLRKVQILNERQIEETAIAAYLVSDGIDQCRVGFLQRHMLKYARQYDGVLAQVTEVYCADSESPMKRKKYHHNRGCCLAVIISSIPADATPAIATAPYRTNQPATEIVAPIQTPPRRQDNENSGGREDLLLSADDDIVTDICTSSEQDDIAPGSDNEMNNYGVEFNDDDGVAEKPPVTVATKKKNKKTQKPPSTPEPATVAKKTRTTKTPPQAASKQA